MSAFLALREGFVRHATRAPLDLIRVMAYSCKSDSPPGILCWPNLFISARLSLHSLLPFLSSSKALDIPSLSFLLVPVVIARHHSLVPELLISFV